MDGRDIVVIAVSTGGLHALGALLAEVPVTLRASIFVVMHIGPHRSVLPKLLEGKTRLRVQHAIDSEAFEQGVVYVAPPDKHLLLRDGRTVLSRGPKQNFTRPAADPLFRSAAVHYGPRVIGIVMTGRLDDGAAGLKAVAACGGYTMVQDPKDSEAPDMPQYAIAAVRPDRVLPLRELGAAMATEIDTGRPRRGVKAAAPSEALRIETRIEETGIASMSDMDRIGQRSTITCPECGGVVWRIGHGADPADGQKIDPESDGQSVLRFRCHTGHAFSARSLDAEQARIAGEAIWTAARVLHERIALAKEMMGTAAQTPPDEQENLRRTVARWEQSYQQLVQLAGTGMELADG